MNAALILILILVAAISFDALLPRRLGPGGQGALHAQVGVGARHLRYLGSRRRRHLPERRQGSVSALPAVGFAKATRLRNGGYAVLGRPIADVTGSSSPGQRPGARAPAGRLPRLRCCMPSRSCARTQAAGSIGMIIELAVMRATKSNFEKQSASPARQASGLQRALMAGRTACGLV